jgi:hypothetical protein
MPPHRIVHFLFYHGVGPDGKPYLGSHRNPVFTHSLIHSRHRLIPLWPLKILGANRQRLT